MARRVLAMSAATALGLTALAGTASADEVRNDLDAGVQSMSLTVGGEIGATTLTVYNGNANDGDTVNACNLRSDLFLEVRVVSSNTSVAVVNPSTVRFDDCAQPRPIAVTAMGAGTAEISVERIGGTADGVINYAPATFTVVVSGTADTTAPEIGYVLDPATPDGDNGWYSSDVSLIWSVTEDESLDSLKLDGCDNQEITTDQQATVYSCSATSDGGSAGPVTVTIKRDATAPTVGYTSASGDTGNNGWYVGPVTATFTATDATSGFTGGSLTTTGTSTSTGEGAAVAVASPVFTDLAGNTTAAGAASQGFKIDLTAPRTPTFVGEHGDYYYGQDPTAPTCTSSDDVSGLASCLVTGGGTGVGTHTWTATATDNAGRTSTNSFEYEVLAWTLNGFYKPVDMGDGVYNTVKAGSTVPLKFEVFAGATERTSVSDVRSFTQKAISCESGAVTDEVEFTTTGGTTLRYDTTAGQFVQNWQTPKKPGACYEVTMTTQDGSTLVAKFKLR